MRVVALIPARMASSRFPGKPLVQIAGKPMLEHCYLGANSSSKLDEVIVATCDQEIAHCASGLGIRYVMTSKRHKRCTDRVAEAALSIDADVIVLVQGDEPLVTGDMIDAALGPLLAEQSVCTTLVKRIESVEEFEDPNTIKVVADNRGRAMYFSRSPIPTRALVEFEELRAYKHVAIVGFTRAMLLEYSTLEPTPLEITESIDMLRHVEHGRPVDVVETDRATHAVDVEADIATVERLMAR